jgi:N utilization substance protein B
VTEPGVAGIARALADAVRRGEDPTTVGGSERIERHREAAALIREANRKPGPDTDPRLLLTEEEIWIIDRQFRRADALAALYEAEVRAAEPDLADLSQAAAAMTAAVWDERTDLDAAIGKVSTGWRVGRMPPVDRCLLRMALWELRHRPDTPTAVVIAEAVRLAKVYSTERSGGFINGVLSRLAELVR